MTSGKSAGHKKRGVIWGVHCLAGLHGYSSGSFLPGDVGVFRSFQRCA